MSKYTTEVRYICEVSAGLKESVGASRVDEIIIKAIPNIFNFDFPIFDENYRTVLEAKILKHFYTREIGEETVGLWQLRLNTKLNEIMPYYNKLYNSELIEFNPLYTINVTRTRDSNRKDVGASGGSSSSSNSSNGTGEGVGAFSDTPQGTLSNVENNTYLTNASKNKTTSVSFSSSSENNNSNSTLDSTEKYLDLVQGFSGGDASEHLMNYRKTFLNIDMMVIKELEDLFMQLW